TTADTSPLSLHDALPILHRLRHRELRVALERVEHLLRGVAGRARVPQTEPRDAVGVHVLGGAFQLGEDGQLVARLLGIRVRHLEDRKSTRLNSSHVKTSY